MVVVQKRKIRWVISLFLVMLYFFGLKAQAQYGGGNGAANDPYLIYTAAQMNAIGANSSDGNKHFKLMADIDLSAYTGTAFNIIGSFRGVFDGNGHTISNFTYTSPGRELTGIFGVAHAPARIEALGLIDPNVDGGWKTGSLVGTLRWTEGTIGTITNCYVVGGRVAGGYVVGGLVGGNNGSFTITNCHSSCSVWGIWKVGGLVGGNNFTMTNCYATGSVSGKYLVGGLVGAQSDDGTITNCYSTGSVSGEERVGGLVGGNWGDGITNSYSLGNVSGNTDIGGLAGCNYGTMTNCYATGDVTGDWSVGGLVGLNSSDDWGAGTITNCYSVGSVMGGMDVGGLLGFNDSFTVDNSFWDIQTSGQTTSAGGTGKLTGQMCRIGTFLAAGWDFVDIWDICEGTNYPRLAWQIPAGDFVCPDGITIEDFVFFIEHWGNDNCDLSNDYCQGTDLDFSGTVDEADLEILVENWLAGVRSD